MTDTATPPPEESAPDPSETMLSREFLGLLVLAALIGAVAALVAWCFLELIAHLDTWIYSDLPNGLGFDSTPLWWSLPVLAIAGVIVAFAIARLPGNGGHVPADGLNAAPTEPSALPGVVLAGVASIALGAVVGPEAPLIAIGGGLGILSIRLLRPDAPPQATEVIGAAGTFAAVAFLFGSPLIAAVLLIEAAGLGGSKLKIVLVPGLLASGIGSLVWIGMGSWTGLSTNQISISALQLPPFDRPDLADFGFELGRDIALWVRARRARDVERPVNQDARAERPPGGGAFGLDHFLGGRQGGCSQGQGEEQNCQFVHTGELTTACSPRVRSHPCRSRR